MDRLEPQTNTAATIAGAGPTKRHAALVREQSNVPDPTAIPLLSPGPQLIQPTQGSSQEIPKKKTGERTLWSALSPGLIESLRTAWGTDKTSCIQRGLCSAAQTLGDLLPPYFLTTGILQASQSNWLGAGLNLALALTTYVLGISAKLRDKYYSSKVANSLERHLEKKLHLSTHGGLPPEIPAPLRSSYA